MNIKTKKPNKAASKTKELKKEDIWRNDKMDLVKAFISRESEKQSPERKLRNEMLAVKFQIQDYLASDTIEKEKNLLDFVKLYLKLLKISKIDLANAFEMKDSNLHKYLIGERKLNSDIVLKLSSFSHTKPEIWYHIQIKNELLKLKREKENLKKYKKYDFENIIKRYKVHER